MRNDQNTGAKTDKRRLVEVEIVTQRWGSDNSESVQIVEVPMIGDGKIRLDITADLRRTESIEIRPVRRDMDDLEGLIEDAERLANN